MRKMKKIIPLTMAFATILCLTGCGKAVPAMNEGKDENIEKEIPESMDASDVAEMLESGMTVDEVIDRVEEVKESEATSTDKPAETASPTQIPASTPAPTAKPTPEPVATPEPTSTPTPHTHAYTVENVTRQATCAEAGEKQLVCECGDAKVESIPATGQHNWVEGVTVVHHEALGHVSTTETQVQVGTTTRTEYECKNCGARFNTPEEKTDHCAAFVGTDRNHATCGTIAHDYSEPVYETRTETIWVVDQEAWDESVGSGTYTCTVCGATK